MKNFSTASTSMKYWIFLASLATIAASLTLTLRAPTQPGPGMTVTVDNAMPELKIDMLRATTPDGREFLGGILYVRPAYSLNGSLGGRVLGASPDGRHLPDWVEFEWKEWEYPYPEKPTNALEEEKWGARIHELSRTLPHKIARVPVQSRVPQDVVDEAIASVIAAPRGKLPEKQIWLHFVWHPNGIWFRWSLKQGSDVLRSGGDALPDRTPAVTSDRS